MDTSKDQQEMERIFNSGTQPWMDVKAKATAHGAYQAVRAMGAAASGAGSDD